MKRFLPILLALLLAGSVFGGTYSVVTESSGRVIILVGRHPESHIQTTTPNAALASVLAMGVNGPIVFRPGTYVFEDSVTVATDDITIEIEKGALWKTTATGSVSLLTLSGDHITLTGGGRIQVDTAVNDQAAIYITGARPKIFDLEFLATTISATTANPMEFIKVYQVQGAEITYNRFIPKRGFICVQMTEGNHNRVESNDFVPLSTGIFEASETAEVTQNPNTTALLGEVYRCIDLQHDGWATVTNNNARMLGRPAANFAGASPLNYGITVNAAAGTYTITTPAVVGANWYINPPAVGQDVVIAGYSEAGNNGTKTILARDATSFTVDPTGLVNEVVTSSVSITVTHVGAVADCFLNYEYASAAAANEGGHLHFVGNDIEDFIAPHYVKLLGCRWGRLVGNSFANSLSGINLATHAAVYLDINDSQPTDDILIGSNQFHNVAFSGSPGGDIRLAECNRINILSNHFSNNLGEYSIIIDDTDEAQDVNILGNVFEGRSYSYAGNQPTSPIRTMAGSSGARMVAGGNIVVGYTGALFTHSSGTPTGEFFPDGLQDSNDGNVPDGTTTVAQLTTNVVLTDPP